jgi:GNAT superfamily N-acetyltransferase
MVRDLLVAEAGVDEREAVRDLLERANAAYRSVLDPAAYEPYLRMVLDVDAGADVSTLLVAREDDRLVGTARLFPVAADEGWGADPGAAGLRSMAVDPEARGRGIGRALVEACVERARAAGATVLALHTASWLPDAIRLYERYGFVRDPAQDRRASELMGVPAHADYAALAYRLPLD